MKSINEKKKIISKSEFDQLLDAIEHFEVTDLNQMIQDVAIGLKSMAQVSSNDVDTTFDRIYNENLDHKTLLSFLLYLSNLKCRYNGNFPILNT
jgi:hypothetical protein